MELAVSPVGYSTAVEAVAAVVGVVAVVSVVAVVAVVALWRIQVLTKGGSDKRPSKAVAPKGVRGACSPGKFFILGPLKCDFQRFQGQLEVV